VAARVAVTTLSRGGHVSAVSAIRSPTRAIRPRRDESRPGYSFGGLQLDDVEKRWRRLVGPRFRERTCSFRCSTVCAC